MLVHLFILLVIFFEEIVPDDHLWSLRIVGGELSLNFFVEIDHTFRLFIGDIVLFLDVCESVVESGGFPD